MIWETVVPKLEDFVTRKSRYELRDVAVVYIEERLND